MNCHGAVIDEEISSFLWVRDVFDLKEGQRKTIHNMPSIKLLLSQGGLKDVVGILFDLLHDNGMAAVFTIGRYIYYPSTRQEYGTYFKSKKCLKLYKQ